MIAYPITLSAGCYVVPKVAAYLTTPPSREALVQATYLNTARAKLAIVHQKFVEIVGERRWEVFSATVVDNAWISALVIGLLFKSSNRGVSREQIGAASIAFIGVGFLSWLCRQKLREHLPSRLNPIVTWVSPRTI